MVASSESCSPLKLPAAVWFVGTQSEVAHHAAPLLGRLPFQIVSPDEVIQTARPGDVALFFSEHFDRFRHAIGQLKQRSVATLYLIDGILEWRNAWENRTDEPACPYTMRPVLCHKAAAIGASQARILNHWGNAGKIEPVGVPRFDSLLQRAQEQRVQPEPEKTSNSDRPFRLLIMTAKTPGFTPQQVATTVRSLKDLKSWLDKNSESFAGRKIQPIWRLTAGLDLQIGVENELTDVTGHELAATLAQVAATISTPSTAMLESMLLDLPTAALDYHIAPKYLQTAWTIAGPDQIESVIGQLMTPSEPKRLFQRLQLSEALFPCNSRQHMEFGHSDQNRPNQNTATDRLISLIVKMMESAQACLASNESLKFPAQILEPPLPPIAAIFDHATIYPNQAEFQQNNPIELQAELAHARREIKHLQRELAQAKSELNTAHTIFNQINNHPVVGPIVRMRKKFLDWRSGNQSE